MTILDQLRTYWERQGIANPRLATTGDLGWHLDQLKTVKEHYQDDSIAVIPRTPKA